MATITPVIPAKSTRTVHFFSEEEYLNWERSRSKEAGKHEFINGKLNLTAGVSRVHSLIQTNWIKRLGVLLDDKPYEVHGSDIRVNNPISGSYCYPDVSVVRGAALLKDKEFDNLLNPCLLIEILSPGTEEYDRTDKFTAYQSILTLQEYVLVASDKIEIEYYRKVAANDWESQIFTGPEDLLSLLNGDAMMKLAAIYSNVTF